MEAGKAFSLVAFLWLLYLLYAPASINPAPPPRPVPQVVAGRVTGTVPPPNGSWAFLRELISPSEWLAFIQMQLMPIWELLHLLMRALFDLLRTGYRWVCRAVAAARHSSLVRGPSAVALTTAPVQPDRLTALARAIDVRAFEHCDGRSLARLEVVSRTFRAVRDDAFRGHAARHSLCEAVAYRRGCRRGLLRAARSILALASAS